MKNNNSDRYSHLNPGQFEAVKKIDGPVICIAGPGSGKTTVIVNRLTEMLEVNRIEPSHILVVTFTRAAAIEMRKRFLLKFGEEGSAVNFGTFHSIFFHILSRSFGYKKENILDDATAFKIMLHVLDGRDLILSGDPEFVHQVLDEISRFKCSRLPIQAFEPQVLTKAEFKSVFNTYSERLKSMNLVDFEDMLNDTFSLLCQDEKVLSYWQNKFKYIMVDEFQDINTVQYDIIKMLAAPQNNLFVVGDDDQSIYAFRGAVPAIMRNFPNDYKNATRINLSINYRCSEEILNASQKLIKNNTVRYSKTLSAYNKGGNRVLIGNFRESRDEYKGMCKAIQKELDNGANPNGIAILYRTNAQSSSICQYLISSNIPFRTKSYIPSIYDNKHVIPVVAYIRFLAGDNSRNNFLQFYNKPVRYITRDSLVEDEIDLDELLDLANSSDKYYLSKNIIKLIKDMEVMKRLTTSAAIHYIRKVVGYEEYLQTSMNMAGTLYSETIDYLEELEHDAADYPSFVAFLEHIEDYKEKLQEIKDSQPVSAVNLLTYHGCKGLEYDSVYMPDCVEGITPHKLSTKPDEIEEERRMFYVAMTRAKNKLSISYSTRRQGHSDNKCSRFVDEIIGDLSFNEGDEIFHDKYRHGIILQVEGDAMTVKFDNLLVPKVLSIKFCVENKLLR